MKCSPSLLISKAKLHVLVHSVDDVERFGPILYVATERFESFNSVVRNVLIHSNRQAPSRDAAYAFAGYDRIKHIFAGGYWRDAKSGHWIQAGPKVASFFSKSPAFADLLNVLGNTEHRAGRVDLRRLSDTTRNGTWGDTLVSKILTNLPYDDTLPVIYGDAVTLSNGEKAHIASHVLLCVCDHFY